MEGRAFPIGKLDPGLLRELLARVATPDPRVLLGPGVGRDVAVLDFGDTALVAKSDPITFATDALGWYAVHVNANDIATSGAEPRWFLATLLLPEGAADTGMVTCVFDQVREACDQIGATLVGGHTEVTYGIDRPIVSGHMLGEVARDRLVLPEGIRPGDAILMTKAIAVEGTSLLGREAGPRLRKLGCTEEEIAEAAACLHDPGISVVPEARALTSAVTVHAMHDPTEGGLATGLWEMAEAGRVGIDVEAERVPRLPVCKHFCRLLGLDPLGLIASGTLLAAVAPGDATRAIAACEAGSIACEQIGLATERAGEVRRRLGDGWQPLPRFDQDELAKLFA